MIKITYEWQCDYCGRISHTAHGGLTVGARHVSPFDLPLGWSIVQRRLVCDMHEIQIQPVPAGDPVSSPHGLAQPSNAGPTVQKD